MKGGEKQLHIVMFPWFAYGHFIPYLHLSNELTKRGHKVTFLLPPKAKLQLDPSNLHPSLITLHPIAVPQVGPLSPGSETASDVPFPLHTHLVAAMDLTRPEFESVVSGLWPKPDLVFYDMAHWVPEVASKLGIKSGCFHVVSAVIMALTTVPGRKPAGGKPVTEDDLAQPPPGYPSPGIVLEPRLQLGVHTPFGAGGITLYDRVTAALGSGEFIAIRACREIEGEYCDYLASRYNKPVLLTGTGLPPAEPGPENSAQLEARWDEWLGRFRPGSVVFCAFGSQSFLDKAQFQEFLLGFEMTKLPFLAAIPPPTGCGTVEQALPEGFKERVGGRGVVYGGWVQQQLILAHPSVGCFVNHCGRSTMWEALASDKQLVLLPQISDHVVNAKIMAKELKVAVEVERENDDGWVSKESLSNAIKSVMDEGSEIGGLVRKNHAMWREILTRPDFVNGYVDNFISDLQTIISK